MWIRTGVPFAGVSAGAGGHTAAAAAVAAGEPAGGAMMAAVIPTATVPAAGMAGAGFAAAAGAGEPYKVLAPGMDVLARADIRLIPVMIHMASKFQG